VISDIAAPGQSISFRVGTAVSAQKRTGQATPNIALPDNQAAGVSSAIAISGSGTVAAISVKVVIEHPYIGDLRVTLQSPGGLVDVLHARLGGPTDNLIATYTSATPGVLATMVGQPLAGNWVLNVSDRAARDVGALKSWSIELESAPAGIASPVHLAAAPARSQKVTPAAPVAKNRAVSRTRSRRPVDA